MTPAETPPAPRARPLDFDACYRATSGRDARWDGRIYLGVTSTGIYCRPSCPARTPRRENCRFFASAAACVAAGFRACKRCRPDALPGSRDWDVRGDLAARAVRRIRDGAIDAHGVTGLARELAVSDRHLRRVLIDEVGASPVQLARTRRADAARALIEQTDLPLSDIAFAAGFGSLRQFGDTMREEFGMPPSSMPRTADTPRQTQASARPAGGAEFDGADPAGRSRGGEAVDRASDERPRLALRLRARAPYDAAGMHAFLVAHAIPGRDEAVGTVTAHALDVPGGTAVARIDWAEVAAAATTASVATIPLTLALPQLADVMPAIAAVRRLLDLDADPSQIAEALGGDPLLGPLLAQRPGLRLPGARHPQEFALGTVLGQQVSLASARTLQGRLAARFAKDPVSPQAAAPGFVGAPDVARIATTPVEELRTLGLNGARAEMLRAVAVALDAGLDLGPGADRALARVELAALRGIGPWSVELIAMRALGDPDAFPAGDLILRRALGTRSERETRALAEPWRPFRGYATQHLWADFLADKAATSTAAKAAISRASRPEHSRTTPDQKDPS